MNLELPFTLRGRPGTITVEVSALDDGVEAGFDAPAHNLSGAGHLTWSAHAFLVTAPLRDRSEPVVPLAGFSWGYDEWADGRPPPLHPLVPADRGVWARHLDVLRSEYPRWTFGD